MNQKYFKIKITKVGYLFMGLCLGVGFAALNTGNNLLYLIFAMMLSFIVLSGLLSNSTLTHLVVQTYYPLHIFAKRPLDLMLRIENKKKQFPSLAISIKANDTELLDLKNNFIVKINAHEAKDSMITMTFKQRGQRQMPNILLETHYPFGFLKKTSTFQFDQTLIIYPELFDIKKLDAFKNIPVGQHLTSQKGHSLNPYGIREFIHGDDHRYIHWKSSAKNQSLKIKEFEAENKNEIDVHLVLLKSEFDDPNITEKTISLTATLIARCFELKHKPNLFINLQAIVNPSNHLDVFMTALALAKPQSLQINFSMLKGYLFSNTDLRHFSIHNALVYDKHKIEGLNV